MHGHRAARPLGGACSIAALETRAKRASFRPRGGACSIATRETRAKRASFRPLGGACSIATRETRAKPGASPVETATENPTPLRAATARAGRGVGQTIPGLGTYPPEVGERFSQLEPEQQRQFLALHSGSQQATTQVGLVSLLAAGTMTETDQQGRTVLDHLSRLPEPLRAGVVDTLANPSGSESLSETPVTNSSLQSSLAHHRPAEYARVVADLAGPEGSSSLDGYAFLRPPGPPGDSQELFQNSITESTARHLLFGTEVAHREAFQRLSSDEQLEFREVYDATFTRQEGGFFAPGVMETTNAARAGLLEHLETGSLTSLDAEGNTLLQNLAWMARQSSAEEDGLRLDGRQLMREVLIQTADPGSIRQADRGTCAVTTVEYLQAKHDPADYARVIRGLASQEGSVELRDGSELTRDDSLVARDGSGRSHASQLYQASLMEFANGQSVDYDNQTDAHRPFFGPLPRTRGRREGGAAHDA